MYHVHLIYIHWLVYLSASATINSSLRHANARLCHYIPQATGACQPKYRNIETSSSDQLHQRSPPAPVKAVRRWPSLGHANPCCRWGIHPAHRSSGTQPGWPRRSSRHLGLARECWRAVNPSWWAPCTTLALWYGRKVLCGKDGQGRSSCRRQ